MHGSQTRFRWLYERTVSNLDFPGSVDRCPGRAAIYNHPCSLPLSLSLSPTWLSSSVSLLHPRFQPMPPFDVGPVSLCYLASLQALSASSPFEIYPFDYPFSFLSSPSKHTLSLKTSNILSTGKNIGFTWLSSAYDIDLRDSMANKFKWTVPAPLATVQTQD